MKHTIVMVLAVMLAACASSPGKDSVSDASKALDAEQARRDGYYQGLRDAERRDQLARQQQQRRRSPAGSLPSDPLPTALPPLPSAPLLR